MSTVKTAVKKFRNASDALARGEAAMEEAQSCFKDAQYLLPSVGYIYLFLHIAVAYSIKKTFTIKLHCIK